MQVRILPPPPGRKTYHGGVAERNRQQYIGTVKNSSRSHNSDAFKIFKVYLNLVEGRLWVPDVGGSSPLTLTRRSPMAGLTRKAQLVEHWS